MNRNNRGCARRILIHYLAHGICGVPSGRDQVDAIGSMTDEQLLHVGDT